LSKVLLPATLIAPVSVIAVPSTVTPASVSVTALSIVSLPPLRSTSSNVVLPATSIVPLCSSVCGVTRKILA
jgi:hypothetical protein